MRSYVTIVDGDVDILPFFARYYTQALGVDEFYLLTFGTEEHQRTAHNILFEYANVVLGPILPAETFLAGVRDTRRNLVRKRRSTVLVHLKCHILCNLWGGQLVSRHTLG